MEIKRTSSIFGFCRHAKNQPGKTKRAIFSQRLVETRETEK